MYKLGLYRLFCHQKVSTNSCLLFFFLIPLHTSRSQSKAAYQATVDFGEFASFLEGKTCTKKAEVKLSSGWEQSLAWAWVV